MKVILNQDVPNLGEEGEILEVAPGYARNYLIPKKLVSMHSPQNIAILAGRKAAIERKREEKRKSAASDKEKIIASTIVLHMPSGEGGKLFGSVTSATVADELAKLGVAIERKKIEVPGHVLKHTGDFKLSVKLYGNETAELKVQILPLEESKKV